MRSPLSFFLLIAVFVVSNASAQVYKTTDEHGRVIFTDKPVEEAEAVDTELKNVHSPIKNRAPLIKPKEEEKTNNYQITLVSPQDGAQLGPSQRNLNMSVSLKPKLSSGYSIEYLFSGERVVGPTKSQTASIPIGIKSRGQRAVIARVVDQDGNVIATSNSATVFVIRP